MDISECDHDDQQWETQSGWGELGAMLASEKTGAELTELKTGDMLTGWKPLSEARGSGE